MLGRRFWSRDNFYVFERHQLFKFLLLAIAISAFTVAWTSGASSCITLRQSNAGANYSLLHQDARKPIGNQAERQDASAESSESPSDGTSTRRVIALLEGYDVKVHGFGFENYGNEKDYVQLTSAEVERMFGERACASKLNDECVLTPVGEQWMEQRNQRMGRGHCDGMAALSLLFYLNHLKVEDFGGSSVNTLQLEGNEKLQREIAYWWTTQSTEPTRSAREKNELTPREVVNELVKAFTAGGNSEVYTIALWKRNGKGGHAVTPFAIEERDNGIFAILVYDNNYPNITRKIIVDSNANTWKYNTSINPNEPEYEYEGDANTMSLLLTPTSFRLRTQECPFCEQNNVISLTAKSESMTADKVSLSRHKETIENIHISLS